MREQTNTPPKKKTIGLKKGMKGARHWEPVIAENFEGGFEKQSFSWFWVPYNANYSQCPHYSRALGNGGSYTGRWILAAFVGNKAAWRQPKRASGPGHPR